MLYVSCCTFGAGMASCKKRAHRSLTSALHYVVGRLAAAKAKDKPIDIHNDDKEEQAVDLTRKEPEGQNALLKTSWNKKSRGIQRDKLSASPKVSRKRVFTLIR